MRAMKQRASRAATGAAVAVAAALFVGGAQAVTQPVLVKDINPGSLGSGPSDMTGIGGGVLFGANNGVSGEELWKTDGTAAGTVLVKDINPGSESSVPNALAVLGGRLLFSASDSRSSDLVFNVELWSSDGTNAGTVLVKDINPGIASSNISPLTAAGGISFFRANDGVSGDELWKSDGTSAGTVLVKDINPGAVGSNAGGFVDVGGTLFFRATNSFATGAELWKTDGTEAGTVLVKDINPAGNSLATPFDDVGGTLFLSADDGSNGFELWKSDGTAAGTVLVKDINPGGDAFPFLGVGIGGTFFFRARDGVNGFELWKSDGTAAGTVLVKDINPGSAGSAPTDLTDVGGTLYFRASDGTSGTELWKSDGTAAGTVLVKDINPGSASSAPSLREFLFAGGQLYFAANDGTHGTELWTSDGTEAGTTLVTDIFPGSGESRPNGLTEFAGRLFFGATDGTKGQELWTLSLIAPTVDSLTVPVDPVAVGTSVIANASFSDAQIGDTHTATFDWGDGTSSAGIVSGSTITGSHAYAAAGLYTVTVTVTDAGGASDSASAGPVVVYDPDGGFATGGGWISAAGSKANFGFVARYRSGESVPSGELEFRTEGIAFSADAYQWLVVSGGSAELRGTGSLNGVSGYTFHLSAFDGSPDTFRLRIELVGTVVYDSGSEPLGGGSVRIHG